MEQKSKPIVWVDKREFRSDLPSQLYHGGFVIIPRVMDMGDYLLSNDMVIERKKVRTGDLAESIKLGGRLEAQLGRLSRAFRTVIVLIEFSDSIRHYDLSSASSTQSWRCRNVSD